jgi:hypothetical protein
MAIDDFMAGLPVIGGLFDDSSEQAKAYFDKILKEYQGLSVPDVSWQDFTPEMYSYDYSPESIQASLVQEDPLLIQAQRDYLSKLAGLSESGLSEGDQAGFQLARMGASADAKSARDALARQAMAQGTYGSNQDFMSRQMANQAAAERAQRASLEQAQEAARQRTLYTQAYGQGLEGARTQDLSRERLNQDVINRFNQLNTQARNEANLGRNEIANSNVAMRNAAKLTNQEQRLGQRQQGFENQLTKTGGLAGAYGNQAAMYSNLGAKRAAQRAQLGKGIGYAIGGPAGAAIGGGLGDLF